MTQLIGGEYYYFYPNTGIMAKNTTIDGTMLTESGGAMSARYVLNHITHSGSIQLWNMHTSLSSGRLNALYSAIQSFNARGWAVGFVLVDIKTGRAVSYNAGVNLYSASAIKGPYVLSLLSAGYAPTGAMWNTISWSSNTDYSAIRSRYGAGVFQNWLAAAGVSQAQGSSQYTTTTPLDLAKMWLYGYSYLGGNYAYSGWARSVFSSTLSSAIQDQLGSMYTTYSKAGWIDHGGYYNVFNCAGIVNKSTPYVLAIMSNSSGTSGMRQMKGLVAQLDAVHSEMIR